MSEANNAVFSHQCNIHPAVSGKSRLPFLIQCGLLVILLASGGLASAADLTPPTVTLLSPKTKIRTVNAAPVTFSGRVADKSGVAAMSWAVSTEPQLGNSPQTAIAITPSNIWSFAITPVPGTNFVFVRASDSLGNQRMVQYQVFYSKPTALTVLTNGNGKLSLANGAMLEVGRFYTVTAKPAPGNILGWWRVSTNTATPGDVQWVSSGVRFRMAENLAIQAVFITNPFQAAQGSYSGLVLNKPDGVQISPPMSGSFSLSIAAAGTYSAILRLCSGTYSFSGQLNLVENKQSFLVPAIDPTATELPGPINVFYGSNTISRGKLAPLTVQFSLDQNQPGVLTGVIRTNDANSIPFSARLTPSLRFNRNEGNYTIQFQGETTAGAYGSALANEHGVKIVINLPDQMGALTFSSREDANGSFTVFAPLYSGKGLLIGSLTLTNGQILSQPTDSLVWIKPGSHLYPDGIYDSLTAYGDYYARRSAFDWVDWDSGVIEIQDGWDIDYSADVFYNRGSLYVPWDENDHSISISGNTRTGEVWGWFYPDNSWHAISFKGVMVDQYAYGFFIGEHRPGWFSFGPYAPSSNPGNGSLETGVRHLPHP